MLCGLAVANVWNDICVEITAQSHFAVNSQDVVPVVANEIGQRCERSSVDGIARFKHGLKLSDQREQYAVATCENRIRTPMKRDEIVTGKGRCDNPDSVLVVDDVDSNCVVANPS